MLIRTTLRVMIVDSYLEFMRVTRLIYCRFAPILLHKLDEMMIQRYKRPLLYLHWMIIIIIYKTLKL